MRYSRYLRPRWAAALALMAATALINSSHAASLVSAGSITGDFSVGVEFDEPLDEASATLAANYEVSGATVSSAVLRSDRIVELAVDASVAAGFTLTVDGVNTASGTPISGSVTGELSELIPQNLGSPASSGRAIFTGESYWATAGGNDIWGTGDNGFFVHTEHTGSFDMRARVESLVEGDEWAKAGLMVRENVGGASRNQIVLITKNGPYPPYRDGGVNVYNHQWRDAEAGSSAGLATADRITPTVFPSWIRLVRETASSQELNSYVSYDGEEWVPLGTHTFPIPTTGTAFPETVYIGMAFTAHDNDQAVTPMTEAVISDFQIHAAGFDDNEPPTIVRVSGNKGLNTLTVVFSEAVDPTTAADLANYTVTPSLTLSNPQIPVPNTVVFTTSAQTEGADYTLTINDVADASPQANVIAADSQASFKAWLLANGFLTAEFFTGIAGTPVANLTSSQKYINNEPDDVRFLPNADTPNGYGDEYGLRLTGWLVPKESGNYYFFIRSDDASQLFINPNGEAIPNPTEVFADAEETDCCDAFVEPYVANDDLGTYATTLYGIPLEAGERYGFLFLMKEGTGGDWSQVAWRLEGDTTPAAELQPISGEFFETMVDATGSALSITTQPVDVSVRQNRPASFSVAVDSSSPDIGYQWLKDGVEIPGARGATYQIEAADAADNGSEYSVHLRIPGVSVTSDVATLTVNTDETAPVVLGAGAFEGGSTVGVGFDEPLDEATATDPANYTVSGANVTAATLHAGRVVELTLDGPVASGFTVTITDVADVLENAITSVVADGIITDMVHQDLGTPGADPIEPGRAFTWGTGFFIGAGGNDIWDTDDAGHIIYKEFTGSFDMKARMDSLINGDEWGKVGLMVRESLAPGSRNEYIAITKSAPQINPPTPLEPHIGGVNVYTHQWRNTLDTASASKPGAERISPTVFPSWLRLVRESTESNEIKSYISYDGEEWLLYHTHTIPNELLPETLFLGIAATSHDNAVGFPLVEGVVEGFSIVPFSQAVDPNLSVIAEASGDLVISWEIGTLVASPTVNGTYEPVAGAISPYNVTAAGTAMFYQVQTSP